MASVKFEIGFNFDGLAGWKVIPNDIQQNTKGFEYYWSFEHEVNKETNFCVIDKYIIEYLRFLFNTLSAGTLVDELTFKSEFDFVISSLDFDDNWGKPIKLELGDIFLSYVPTFDKLKHKASNPTEWDIKFQNELDDILKA